ncbi:MAG: 16S rRNA (adenine(1518)-N(6)/adenine(1519)-N(6))-dimethyltransferase RsmA [Spirochaetales bacterium]
MSGLQTLVSLHPWTFLTACALPALYVGPWWPLVVVLALALAGLTALLARHLERPGRWTALLLAGATIAAFWGVRPELDRKESYPVPISSIFEGTGVVSREAPLSRSGESRFQLRIDSVASEQGSGPAYALVTVRNYRGPSPGWGQKLTWKGTLEGAELRWRQGSTAGWETDWQEWRYAARSRFFAVLSFLDEPSAALGEALVLGAVDDLTTAEKASFRDAGCSHVLALSGMHLSLLALVLAGALRRRAPPLVVLLVTQAVLGAFCLLAGPIPSLYRAWMMALADGLVRLNLGRPDPLDLLAQSFLLTVCLWPEMAGTLSLQLSFLSMLGLSLWSRRCEWALRPWMGRWGGATLGSSVAALVATLPLTVGLFGEVHWTGLLLSAPLVALTNLYLFLTLAVLGLGLAGLLGFLPWVPELMRFLYDLIFGLTGWGAGWPALSGPLVALCAGAAALGRLGVFLYNRHHRGGPMPVSLRYDSPTDLQAFLDSRGFNALKRWGQNFLINPGARAQIVAALDLQPGEPVWEVGPGLGALTHHLVEAGHPLTVFEIDPGYAVFLREEFGDSPAGFTLLEGDVIKTWRGALEPEARSPGLKCVGNLPYNAASAIVADFVEGGYFPQVLVVTVQKEMADRMTATVGTKNYSSFSVLCQSVFGLTDVLVLKPGSFYPAPEVTSRVVKLVPHQKWPELDHKLFSVLVRECFSSRRKTLRNNLPGAAAALRLTDDALKNAFLGQGIDLGRRAETLTVEEFVRVYGSTGLVSTSQGLPR